VGLELGPLSLVSTIEESKALCYKPEGHRFEIRGEFLQFTYSFRLH
jgi:hypothetical protein